MFHWLVENMQDFLGTVLHFKPSLFWANCHPEDPRLRDHPIKAQPDFKNRAHPLVLHGDGAQFTDLGDSLLTLSWGFLGATEETTDAWRSCFVIISIVKSIMCNIAEHGISTLQVIFDHICASFNVCLLGILPQRSIHGVAFDIDCYAARLVAEEATFALGKALGFL